MVLIWFNYLEMEPVCLLVLTRKKGDWEGEKRELATCLSEDRLPLFFSCRVLCLDENIRTQLYHLVFKQVCLSSRTNSTSLHQCHLFLSSLIIYFKCCLGESFMSIKESDWVPFDNCFFISSHESFHKTNSYNGKLMVARRHRSKQN